ncbi:MAG: hypothetical protein AAF826_02105 [Pseudomonadota bacterium]
MVGRLIGASLRALLVGVLLALTLTTMPDVSAAAADAFSLITIVICGFVLVEYGFRQPALLEFRFANPYNRWRFASLVMIMMSFVVLCGNVHAPTPLNICIKWLADFSQRILDFPFSPVFVMRGFLENDVSQKALEMIVPMASLGFLIAVASTLLFIAYIFSSDWPVQGDTFHFWSNLPTFQTLQPENAGSRLFQAGLLNLIFALMVPYGGPLVVKNLSDVLPIQSFVGDFALFWIISFVTWLPLAFAMRGIALYKVSRMIRTEQA